MLSPHSSRLNIPKVLSLLYHNLKNQSNSLGLRQPTLWVLGGKITGQGVSDSPAPAAIA